ncbi:MAG: hypothetical protein OCD00_11000 [Colwellia sp.]
MRTNKKQQTEFTKEQRKAIKKSLKELSKLCRCSKNKLPLYVLNRLGKKMPLVESAYADLEGLCLEYFSTDRTVYLDVKKYEEENISLHWVMVNYGHVEGKPNTSYSHVSKGIIENKPTIVSIKSSNYLRHYWLVECDTKTEADNLQKQLHEKFDGKGRGNRPKRIRLSDKCFHGNTKNALAGITEGAGYKCKYLVTETDVLSPEGVAESVGLDFFPLPQPIIYEGVVVKEIETKFISSLFSSLKIDMKYHNHGDFYEAFPAMYCSISTAIGSRFSIVFDEQLLTMEQVILPSMNLSSCHIGGQLGGGYEGLELVKKVGEFIEHQLSRENITKEKRFKANKMLHEKEKSLVKEAVFKEFSQVFGYQANMKDSLMIEFGDKLIAVDEAEPELKQQVPIIITNSMEALLAHRNLQSSSFLHMPISSTRFYQKLAKSEQDEHNYSNLLNILSEPCSPISTEQEIKIGEIALSSLNYFSPNEFDSLNLQQEQENKSYKQPLHCMDMYTYSTTDHFITSNNNFYLDDSYKEYCYFNFDLNKWMSNIPFPIIATFDEKGVGQDLIDDWEAEVVDVVANDFNNVPWLKNRILNLKFVVRKVSLINELISLHDESNRTFEEFEYISARNVVSAIKFGELLLDNLIKLHDCAPIDYINAQHLSTKLSKLDGMFTATTIYKEKGWGGVKDNPERTRGALEILAKFKLIYKFKTEQKGDNEVIHWKVNPLAINRGQSTSPRSPQ